MAYFTVKRDMAPITLGIERNEVKTPRFKRTRAFIDKESKIQGWAMNLTLSNVKLLLSLQIFELSTGNKVLSKEELCELPPNSSSDLFDTTLLGLETTRKGEPLIVSVRLLDPSDKTVVARCTNWPQPYRYLDMPKALLQIRAENGRISVKTEDVPVKGLLLYVDDVDSVKFDDNCLDVVPGDEQIITAKGLENQKLQVRYYGMEKEWEVSITQ